MSQSGPVPELAEGARIIPDVEIRPWLEDTLRRLPTEKDIIALLPENWQPVTAK